MMGRRRNQADAGGGAAAFGNPGLYLAAGQLTALAGLSALGNLDLNFVRIDQIIAGYAKATGCNLLNGAALAVAVRHGLEAARVLATFASVGAAANTVHSDSQAFMSLLT